MSSWPCRPVTDIVCTLLVGLPHQNCPVDLLLSTALPESGQGLGLRSGAWTLLPFPRHRQYGYSGVLCASETTWAKQMTKTRTASDRGLRPDGDLQLHRDLLTYQVCGPEMGTVGYHNILPGALLPVRSADPSLFPPLGQQWHQDTLVHQPQPTHQGPARLTVAWHCPTLDLRTPLFSKFDTSFIFFLFLETAVSWLDGGKRSRLHGSASFC